MSAMKITFLLAIAGHLLCGACDCLLTYMPGGRFHFEDMKDNDRISAVFKGMSLRNSLLSMLLGCLAMFLFAFGYLSLAHWMSAFSEPCAVLMLISTVMVLTFGVAHHVFCGMPEWLYVKMGRTEEARQLISRGAYWNCGVAAVKLGYLTNAARQRIDYEDYQDLLSKYAELAPASFEKTDL